MVPPSFSKRLDLVGPLREADVLCIGWEHTRDSALPREIVRARDEWIAAGVTTLVLEIPSNYQKDLDAGDLSFMLQTSAGVRRARMARSLRQAGIRLIAGDADERWVRLNPLSARKQNPKRWKKTDERWMAERDQHVADTVVKLDPRERSKVVVLFGESHRPGIVRALRQTNVRVASVDARFIRFAKDGEGEAVSQQEKKEDADMLEDFFWEKVRLVMNDPEHRECPGSAPDTTYSPAMRERLFAWREFAVLFSHERISSYPRALEIAWQEFRKSAVDSNSQTAHVPPTAFLDREPISVSVGDQTVLLQYMGPQADGRHHGFLQDKTQLITVEDPGVCHRLAKSKMK